MMSATKPQSISNHPAVKAEFDRLQAAKIRLNDVRARITAAVQALSEELAADRRAPRDGATAHFLAGQPLTVGDREQVTDRHLGRREWGKKAQPAGRHDATATHT